MYKNTILSVATLLFLSFNVYAQEANNIQNVSNNVNIAQANNAIKNGNSSAETRNKEANPIIVNSNSELQNTTKVNESDKIYVEKFFFVGNRVLENTELKLAIQAYEKKRLSFQEITNVSNVITNYYRKKGYVISYAYIPEQVVKDSAIQISIVEGKIGEVTVNGITGKKLKFVQDFLEPLKGGIVLDSHILERSLLLINSFMGMTATATLAPGENAGTSNIIVNVVESNPYRVYIGFDNFGTKETNEYRLVAAATFANLFKSGDRISLNFSTGLDNFKFIELLNARLDYKLPLGNDGTQLGFAYARSDYQATKDFKKLELKGFSNDYSLYVEYPALLRSIATINFNASFNVKDAQDELLNTEFRKDTLFNFYVGINGDIYPWYGASMYYNFGMYQGANPMFNGSQHSSRSSNEENGGYSERFYLDFQYYQNIVSFFRTRLFFAAQTTTETSFAPEKFYIGGINSVRGFESGIDSGDHGYKLNIEAEFDLYTPRVKMFAFYDRGQVGNYDNAQNRPYKEASLDSVGVGLRIYPYRGFTLAVDYGYPLQSSQKHEASWGKIYGRISYDF